MSVTASSGLISQIDYQALIEQLVSVKRQPIDQLAYEKDLLEDADSAYDTLKSRLSDLKSAADDLRSTADFKVFTTSVTDETILGASATSDASAGTYSITVNNLAQAHKLYDATGVASESTVVGTVDGGSLKFTVNGTQYSVSVDSTTTLSELRDAINNAQSAVTATTVNDGTNYKLILTSNATGASNSITIDQNDTSISFSTLQAAQDAEVVVDGLTITRSSNTISDIITGVTLDLKSADSTKEVTLTVNRDTDAIEEKIVAFVDKYNAVVSHIQSNNRYDTDTKTAGPLFGDGIARSVWEDLRRLMTSAIDTLPSTMNRLIHVGITSDTEGKMSVDSSDLVDALTNNFDDVVNLFIDAASTGGTTEGFADKVYDLVDDMLDIADGRITSKQKYLGDRIDSLTRDIDEKEKDLLDYQEALRLQFAALESLLSSLRAQSDYMMNL